MRDKKIISAQKAARLIEGSGRIFFGGCASEPRAIIEAVRGDPDLWMGQTIVGTFIPGVNDQDFSALGRQTRVESIFATRGLNEGASAGQVALLPMHYSAFWRYIATPGCVKTAFLEVAAPRSDGSVGLGISADFALAPIAAGAQLVGVINSRMPDVMNGPRLPADRFAAFVDDEHSLPIYDAGTIDEATAVVARRIVSLLRPYDTLQLGLGKVQSAVLDALGESGLDHLAFHAGMISTPMLPLLEKGTFSEGITTGVALGNDEFYAEVARRDKIRFAPVGYTHAQSTFAAMQRFISINSVLEVDLYGQANGEFLGGRQISGHGGMVDFIRGTRQSGDGISILALPSTGRNGSVSRIVSHFENNIPASVARSDVDVVVTEYGIAELRNASFQERAERLVGIAHPDFREELERRWRAARLQET